MKKFLFAATVLALCLLALYGAVYYGGFYLDLAPDAPVTALAKTQGQSILVRNEAGEYEPFTVRGVALPSAAAGSFSTEFAIDEETWSRWFSLIADMGANTLRIYTIYDEAFYNALYAFNDGNASPLYLLQGLQVTASANASAGDAYAAGFRDALRQDALDAVDVVHGRKNIALNNTRGSGSYRRDVSQWVLGYVIGNEWDAGVIAYTDHAGYPNSYEGEYLRTGAGATAFEAMLAGVMDGMVSYESAKYKAQRPVGVLSTPETDPFAYDAVYSQQRGKYAAIDAEHIEPAAAFEGGCFAAYRLYVFCPGYADYFTDEQRAALGTALEAREQTRYCEDYASLLTAHHARPVLITDYGFSTARGTVYEPPLTEHEQGEALMAAYGDFLAAGCAGASISAWQDTWAQSAWNTSYAQDLNALAYWHDVQTVNQCMGLIAFEPGEAARACYVDGDASEWEAADVIARETNGLTLSAKYDEEGLYLLLAGEAVSAENALYLPIDVTPNSGASISEEPALSFARGADFLLLLGGADGGRLLVQARYEALRENYLMQTAGENPFVAYPARDAAQFVPIRMILEHRNIIDPSASEEERIAAALFDTYETGRLREGNANPASAQYDSLADYCYGEGMVEVRLPWALLNFSNPSKMEVHADYYEHYGVEWRPIDALWIGAGAGEGQIPMHAVQLAGWAVKPAYHERLKDSYAIVKESWGGADAS